MNKNTDFPQYRRLGSLDVYYKIFSAVKFVEIKRFGSKWMTSTVQAVQYPERLKIMDMLALEEPYLRVDDRHEIEELESKLTK